VMLPVSVRGLDRKLYFHRDLRNLVVKAAAGKLIPTHTTLLSPFDPIVWDRARVSELFDFDYRLECYTPESKRLYGYFTLPILYRGTLIGRVDAKAHRKVKVFEVKVIHFEPHVTITEEMIAEIALVIQRFANWQATPKVNVTRSEPTRVRRRLQSAIRKLT
ncbi:MAG: crosslink repair DNA glycosylase YcaQ family protein, partial [Pyrinomonadaceae bacterium]